MKRTKLKFLPPYILFFGIALVCVQCQQSKDSNSVSAFSNVAKKIYKKLNLQRDSLHLGHTHFNWPDGKKMAISLTFDDSRLSQIDKGIPLLDKYNVKGTFYISPHLLTQRVEEWKKAARNGHEIGNHTFTHPCSGNFSFSRDNALENHTFQSMKEDIDSANMLIEKTLGYSPVSFAYPCGETFVGRGENTESYVPLIAAQFKTGRKWRNETANDPLFCDLAQIKGIQLDGKSFEEVLRLIEAAKRNGQWLVLVGHEMDNKKGELTSLLSTIEAICQYASKQNNGVWIDNVQNIASFIKEQRDEKVFSEFHDDTDSLFSVY
ncbi:MAG TPA: polysaccharide deacetylase [Porphyromonadaceae bacterium]|jgi:peptidoglycan/xylan/chitin deacetylase (PgdA/CDA1 family)|nr:polysaccharide deacetylase [Porphyromonadaceae bacterium]